MKKSEIFNRNRLFCLVNLTDIGYILSMG
jgi:hypothetical protein